MRHLDFFQIVDADGIAVAMPRQKDLDEVACDAKFLERPFPLKGMHAGEFERCGGRLSFGNEVGIEDALSHFREWKVAQGVPDMSTGVPALQLTCQNLVQGGA